MVLPVLGGGYPALKRALEVLSDYARAELVDDGIKVLVVLPYLTATNFGKNALGRRGLPAPNFEAVRRSLPPAHSAEFVANRIVEAVRNEETEIDLAPIANCHAERRLCRYKDRKKLSMSCCCGTVSASDLRS
jgi:short-subunit dehydrogenase